MPITLPPVSRRRFISQSVAAASGLLFKPQDGLSKDSSAEQTWGLFSDSHVAADRELIARGAKMAANLETCVKEALAWQTKPAGAIVCGDCAYLQGQSGDYETFGSLIQPLRQTGLPVHLLMGNHDDRAHFAEVLGKDEKMPSPVEQRHVALIESPFANWFLLDSLDQTNKTPGVLGDTQRAWLEKSLDAHADKPAVVVVHHNIVLNESKTGLMDSNELLAILRPRKHVKACIYGHTHTWEVKPDESGIHLINLPPTAYVFAAPRPNGWVQATLQNDAMKLELRCLDATHKQHGEVRELKWRV